ncbi:hypothetical protein AFK68_14040 [Hydrocoleum sp. CS-953]|nr:hypothetical protein AFK68_14040 [Hydrocoleum sp. CS-953]
MASKSLIVKALKKPNLAFKKGKRYLAHNIEDFIRILTQKDKLSEIVNQKEIRVTGMKRTGNHAIMNWVKSQHTGEVGFLNNVAANENPYRYKYENLQDNFPEHKWAIEHNRQQAKGYFIKRDCLIYSYEDFPLDQIASDKFEGNHDIYLGKSAIRYDLLILRDPFNLLASRLKTSSKVSYFLSVNSQNKTMIDLWLDYAKEYLGETNYLKHNKICINYNQWFADIDYRRQIADKLQMEFSDLGIDKVTGFGGGSSFEGKQFDGKGTSMDVLNRWQKVSDNPQYKQFFDREVLEYSEKIFGHIPGTESLIN